MNTLLVPIDFSDASKNAFHYAAHIASMFHARLTLFHANAVPVAESPWGPGVYEDLIAQEEQRAKAHFEALEQELAPNLLETIELEFKVTLGNVSDEILAIAEEIQPSLIVMGMKASRDLGTAILGSNCEHMIRRADHPLLIIPEHARYHGIRNIAYATNFDEEDRRAIDQLLDFAFLYDAVIHCLHVRQGDETMEQLARRQALKAHYKEDILLHHLDFDEVEDGHIIEGLNHYVRDHNIDMLTMLTHKRGFWANLFTQSVSKKMSLSTRAPLLVFHFD